MTGLRTLMRAFVALALLSGMPQARATDLTGWLELRWGDAAPGALRRGERFTATLVTDGGQRLPLDPAQARKAAGDLYALVNKRVSASLSAGTGTDLYRIDTLQPDLRAKDAGLDAVLGTTVWATIACKFADDATEQKPVSFFQSQYANTPGLLDHYWREVSYDKIDLTGSAAYGWFTLPHPRSRYVTTVNGTQRADLNALFDDCTTAANPQVNFAANGGLQGINMMFNGDLDGFAWGGGRCATLDGVNKCWSTTWNPPWAFNNLAPLAHEMGHGYGLPHANNSDGDADPYDNPWDVMSDAWRNATSSQIYGTLPKHITAYHRDRMGWIDAARKLTLAPDRGAYDVRLDRASMRGSGNVQMIVVQVPGTATRYYTIEARRRIGNYDANLAGDAVIIHQVDSRSTPAWSMDSDTPPADRANNEGSMFKPGETWTAPGGAFRVLVRAATADGFVVSVCRSGKAALALCAAPAAPGNPFKIRRHASPTALQGTTSFRGDRRRMPVAAPVQR
jgi:M6 family metalloprotease-like protein